MKKKHIVVDETTTREVEQRSKRGSSNVELVQICWLDQDLDGINKSISEDENTAGSLVSSDAQRKAAASPPRTRKFDGEGEARSRQRKHHQKVRELDPSQERVSRLAILRNMTQLVPGHSAEAERSVRCRHGKRFANLFAAFVHVFRSSFVG